MAMTTGGKAGIGAAVVIVVALGAFMLLKNNGNDTNKNDTAANNSESTESPQEDSTGADTGDDVAQAAATITYNGSGFSPAMTTVEAGDVVAVKNTSSDLLSFHSDPHPAHTTNAELNVGDIQAGKTATFKVTRKGTFGFHNHLAPSHTGKITVE